MLEKPRFTAAQLAQEVKVSLPLSAVLSLAHDAPVPIATLRVAGRSDLPAIGAEFGGGVFAGVTLADDALAALVLLPGEMDPDTWQKAMAWALERKGVLPSRFDHLVLLKTMRERFKTDTYYWSADEVAGYPEYAWAQDFSNGNQNDWLKSDELRGVAVRRVPI